MVRDPIRASAYVEASSALGLAWSIGETMLSRILIGAAFVLCALPASALPVPIRFDWPSGTPASAQIHILAVRIMGDTEKAASIETEAGPGGIVLGLGEGVWRVRASAAGYWSQGVQVTVNSQAPSSARVVFWPAASLHGEIAMAQGETPPQALDVRLSARPESGSQIAAAQARSSPAHAELSCPIDGEEWSCLAPVGLFDIRLDAEGYAPRYDRDVSLQPAESTGLGQVQLQRALSVFGRAVGRDGSGPAGPCLATLGPDAVRGGGPDSATDNPPPDEKTFAVPVDSRGYFQIIGVMAGRHILAVECPQASGLREIDVQPSGETRVDPPLALQDLTLNVVVTPRTDPTGRPWQLSVDATSPRLRWVVDSATTTADGHWIRHGLMAGSYRVAVRDSGGMQWLQKDFKLRPGSGPLALRLASVRVAGKVMLNGQPVRARLSFLNQNVGKPVTLNSDDEGNFTGRLPITPGAEETVWAVEARIAHPETVRRLEDVDVPTVAPGARAWLDLELPLMPVRGTVTSENNQPQSGAQVTFRESGSGYQTTTSADNDGSFEIADLTPGKYEVVAQSPYGISKPTPIVVTGDSGSRLKLILRPYLHVPIYVVSRQKEPISDAAVQVWVAPGIPKAFGRTDQNGILKVSLPPGTTEIGLTVGADDYAMKLTKMAVSSAPAANGSDPSPDQNTVTLDTNGGTLVLNFEPAEGLLDRSATLYLVHNGAVADARTLSGWDTGQADAGSEGPAEVDGIEPGKYALCVVTKPSQLADLWQGKVPPERCSAGMVNPDQTLTLTPH